MLVFCKAQLIIRLNNIRIKIEKESLRMKRLEYNWDGKTLLVAEDEYYNFRFIEVLLKRTKIKILRASNGQEAIDKVISNSIDLILMDIKMPVKDGLEATREIKQLNSDIPIIAQTAYALHNDENICIAAGCNEYISKPIIQEKLFTMLDKYLT